MRQIESILFGKHIAVLWPEDDAEAARGLLGVLHMNDASAMGFGPNMHLHTVGMSMPIDVIWFNRHWIPVASERYVTPGRVLPSRGYWALEFACGWLARNLPGGK